MEVAIPILLEETEVYMIDQLREGDLERSQSLFICNLGMEENLKLQIKLILRPEGIQDHVLVFRNTL